MGRKRKKRCGAVKKKSKSACATLDEETDRICRTLASEYNHRSSVLCEDMIQELEKRGVSRATLLTNSKVHRLCARLDTRAPPVPMDDSFLRFFMQTCFWNEHIDTRGTYRKTLRFVVNKRDMREVECVFPSLTHWCLFAYNKSWRDRWDDLVGGPDVVMPDKWSLGIGKYLGSWADAADSEEDAMA